ncbi:hypothetical protein PG994_010143 [Apiospora phragmitis]|uniref:Uncharacterized protein n=1 Tax=Apiospora phragmitis TaxID=2905665 RepID=A0ABR1TP95_9PEZI
MVPLTGQGESYERMLRRFTREGQSLVLLMGKGDVSYERMLQSFAREGQIVDQADQPTIDY